MHHNSQCSVFKVHFEFQRNSMKLLFQETSVNSFEEVVGQGLAFLPKSHGGCNSPPDYCQEPPFESILARSPHKLFCPGLDFFFSFLEVVGQNGLEPSTSRLSVVCSSQLSYWPISTSHFLGTSSNVPSKLNNASITRTLCTDLRTLLEKNSLL